MWYQLEIQGSTSSQVEDIENILLELNAVSVTLTDQHDDPILEPEIGTTPLWPSVVIAALFTQESDAIFARDVIIKKYTHLETDIQFIEDKDWERAWMNDFHPRCFGERLWICPTWSLPPVPEAINIMLDPGLAFGSGTHPTTSLCLNWLDSAHLSEKSVIDYGCGSGILAIAAAKLGAEKVYAVDIDPQALQATESNAIQNHVSNKIIDINTPESLTIQSDILIANILLAPLKSLMKRFQELLEPEGLLIVSGILREQTQELIEYYSKHFTMVDEKHMEDWALIVFKNDHLLKK